MSFVLVLGLLALGKANIVQFQGNVRDRQISAGKVFQVARSSLREADLNLTLPNVTLKADFQTEANSTVLLQVICIESSLLREYLQGSPDLSTLCCTAQSDTDCEEGKLRKITGVSVWNLTNTLNQSVIHEEQVWTDLSEGIFYTLIANCRKHGPELQSNGTLTAMNPYGFLPGEAYPNLQFYQLLSGLYAILLFIWTASVCMYRDSAIGLQIWAVTAILAASLLEYMFTYAVCEYSNLNGSQHLYLVTSAAVMKAFKDTFVRAMMIAVAKGLGVVRDSLSKPTTFGVLLLSVAYLSSNLLYEKELYRNLQHHASNEEKVLSSLFLSVFNTVFFYWTYVSLLAVRKELRTLKQSFKLSKFKELSIVLLITGIWAISWIGFQGCETYRYFQVMRRQDEYWRIVWLFEGMWQLVFLFVICAVAWLWKPDEQWKMLAFADEIGQEDQDQSVEEGKNEVELMSRNQRREGYMLAAETLEAESQD